MYEKIAVVLEKAAAYLDAIEADKQTALKAERDKLASILKEKYEEATGEAVSEEMLSKISRADVDLLGVFERLTEAAAEKTATAELGTPAERRDTNAPMSTKEAAAAADDNFLDWVLSN
jgi:hypothetical protein